MATKTIEILGGREGDVRVDFDEADLDTPQPGFYFIRKGYLCLRGIWRPCEDLLIFVGSEGETFH